MTPAPSPLPCTEVAPALARLTRAAGEAPAGETLRALRAHLGACAPCRTAHAARLQALEGLCALRDRRLPAGLLDDLGARVLAEARQGARSGMSVAFLDAPRSLARWRRMAVAASVLVAAGAGLLASGRLAWRDPAAGRGPVGPDLREVLLERLDARTDAGAARASVVPVGGLAPDALAAPASPFGYWIVPARSAVDLGRPAARPQNRGTSD